MRRTLVLMQTTWAFCAMLAVHGTALQAEDNAGWWQFRGGSLQAHGENSGTLPGAAWTLEDALWKVRTLGAGWSSPVIRDHQVWFTAALKSGKELHAVCLAADTGKTVHDVTVFQVADPEAIHDDNSYASPTPVVGSRFAVVHFGTWGTAAIDRATGSIVWKRTDLPCEHQGGPGSSPVLVDGRVIITLDGADRQSVVALNEATGETVWLRDRSAPYRADVITHRAFATPVVRNTSPPELLSVAADQAHAYNALTGEELWHVRFVGFSNVPAPVFDEHNAYLCTGFPKPKLMAVRLTGGAGEQTSDRVVWEFEGQVSTIPTPVIVNDRIYLLTEKGILTCLNAKTGEEVYRERIGGKFSASPLAIGDCVLLAGEGGQLTCVRTGDTYEAIWQMTLPGRLKATPAIAGDKLIVRTDTQVMAFPLVTAN